MPRITERDILDVLHYTVWKTGLEIESELRKKKGVKPDSILKDISIGTMYARLENLEDKGQVERRVKEDISQELLEKRGGRLPYEYRLTEIGTRERIKEPSEKFTLLPDFNPQEV